MWALPDPGSPGREARSRAVIGARGSIGAIQAVRRLAAVRRPRLSAMSVRRQMARLAILLVFLLSCAAPRTGTAVVSLTQLLVRPEQCGEGLLEVHGYLRGDRLYLSEANALANDWRSSIHLSATDRDPAYPACDGQWVVVRGNWARLPTTWILGVHRIRVPSQDYAACWEKPAV